MTTALRERGTGGVPARPRNYYLGALREYWETYGELTAACLSPAAAKRGGRPDLVERYYAGRANGEPWPSLNATKKVFGGFDAARAALGLKPNGTGGRPGGRRKPGEAEPILNVRERRVVAPAANATWVHRQLEKAERRSARLAAQLDEAKARPGEDTRRVEALRQRLADEAARRRDVQRELGKAEKREAARVREVERLTERLAEERSREPKVITKTVTVPSKPEVITKTVSGKSRQRTKVVTKTVKVQDAETLRQLDRLQKRLAESRAAIQRMSVGWEDDKERLREIRASAVATAQESLVVQKAQRRVAELEKQLAAQAELLVGERRQLTTEEVERLRVHGPDRRVAFAVAVRRIAHAEGKIALARAITDAMASLQTWKDRLQ